jgi:hypothetical protein
MWERRKGKRLTTQRSPVTVGIAFAHHTLFVLGLFLFLLVCLDERKRSSRVGRPCTKHTYLSFSIVFYIARPSTA